MITFYIMSIVTFFSYLIAVKLLYGSIPSISDSYYKLKKDNLLGIFTIFCWLVSIPLLIYWIDYSESDWDFLPYLACVSLAFVGASPAFKDLKLERNVHITSSGICFLVAYMWSLLYGNVFLAVNFLLLSIAIQFIIKNNKMYWVEVIAFINIYLQLLL